MFPVKQKISQICSCRIYIWLLTPYLSTLDCSFLVPSKFCQRKERQYKHVTVEYIYDFSFHTYPNSTANFVFVPCQLFQNHGRSCWEDLVCAICDIWPARIEIFWFGHMTGVGHELVATGHFDHLCWVSRYSYLGLGSVVFGGWIGDYRNFIFRNAIKTVWRDSMPGVGHPLVEIGYLDHLCWVRIFISWIWKYWFWMLTWWFLKVHILQNHQLWQHVSTWWGHDCVQTM